MFKYIFMSIETLKSNLNKDVTINRVNVDVLKSKIVEKQKKTKFHNRIILGSILVSVGLLGYFVT